MHMHLTANGQTVVNFKGFNKWSGSSYSAQPYLACHLSMPFKVTRSC